ncbi:hypothetical protein [Granulicella arctica]|uniref:Uncharacterized protein n=1 Tax=Granulicella arctica TaxID=940613 RepID=A0A7Y9PFK6_9BACT|nr:hypothetical protein [Granulicella arctica]NYF79025.1 hypothetical protein [Granulicella arctica]
MDASVAHLPVRKLTPSQTCVIKAEVAAILASHSFSSSKRCQDFLELVVERAVAEDYESLTERFLGVELFGRPVNYETSTDSIVRVRANDVRRRLGQYYADRHTSAPVRIEMAAGGYIPEFHWDADKQMDSSPVLESLVAGHDLDSAVLIEPKQFAPVMGEAEENLDSARTSPQLRFWLWSGVGIALSIVAAFTLVFRTHPSNFDRFWQPVLDTSASPVISLPTTDTFQLPFGSAQTFSQLKPGETLKLGANDVLSFHNWHVSLPVVQAALSLSMALERKGKNPIVRIGTDLRRDELRGHPVIAIGSFSNPWTKQNVSGLRFTFDRGESDRAVPQIRDSLNPQRSWSLLHIFPEPQTQDFAIVTRTFDPVTHEPFVSLAGLHSFGNQIAAEFVAQESSWNEVARRAPSGWEKMNFQVLLETNIVDTTPSSPKIVDIYFWK